MSAESTLREDLAEWFPNDSIPIAAVAVVEWLDADGERQWQTICDVDMPVSATVGLLEMAKLNTIARSECRVGFVIEGEDD